MPVSTEDYGPAGATATAGSAAGLNLRDSPVVTATATAGAATGLIPDPEFVGAEAQAGAGEVAGLVLSDLPGVTAVTNVYAGFGETPFGSGEFGSPEGVRGLTIGDYARADAVAGADTASGTSIWDYGVAAAQALVFQAQNFDLDTLLDAATNDADRVPVFSVLADWDGDNGYGHPLSDLTPVVEAITITREVSGELGMEIGIVEGSSAANVDIVLGGDWQPYLDGEIATDPVKAMAPYRTDAELAAEVPIIGKSLMIETGMQTAQGPVLLPRLTGRVTGFSPSSASRQVQLDGLDPADRLRARITAAAYGVDLLLLRQWGNIKYPHSINSQWLIDRCLRANGYFASPPPGSSGVVLSATMHGSWQDETLGVVDINDTVYPSATVDIYPWAVSDHPFGMLAPNPDYPPVTTWWRLGGQMNLAPGGGWAMSCWLRVPSSTSVNSSVIFSRVSAPGLPDSGFALSLRNGIPTAEFHWGSDSFVSGLQPFGWAQPATPTWMFVGCHWKINTNGITFTIHVNGINRTATGTKPIPTSMPRDPTNATQGYTVVPFTNLSIWYAPSIPPATGWVGETWTPQAKIEQGANVWGGIPELINRESYDLIKEVVAAEFGAFGFDEEGMPYFRSRGVIRHLPEAEVITADRSLVDLMVRVDSSTVRNSIDYEVAVLGAEDYETVFESTYVDEFDCPPNASIIRTIPLPSSTVRVGSNKPVFFLNADEWSSARSDLRYATNDLFYFTFTNNLFVDPIAPGSSIEVKVYQLTRWTAQVRVTCIGTPATTRFATPRKVDSDGSVTEGTPSFRLVGRKVTAVDPPAIGSVQDTASIAKYDVQSYDLGGRSDWRQTINSVDYIAGTLLDWTASPKPLLSQVGVPHNPRRKLYDRVTLVDPEGLGSITTVIHGITTTLSADQGARDQLLLRPETAPAGW